MRSRSCVGLGRLERVERPELVRSPAVCAGLLAVTVLALAGTAAADSTWSVPRQITSSIAPGDRSCGIADDLAVPTPESIHALAVLRGPGGAREELAARRPGLLDLGKGTRAWYRLPAQTIGVFVDGAWGPVGELTVDWGRSRAGGRRAAFIEVDDPSQGAGAQPSAVTGRSCRRARSRPGRRSQTPCGSRRGGPSSDSRSSHRRSPTPRPPSVHCSGVAAPIPASTRWCSRQRPARHCRGSRTVSPSHRACSWNGSGDRLRQPDEPVPRARQRLRHLRRPRDAERPTRTTSSWRSGCSRTPREALAQPTRASVARVTNRVDTFARDAPRPLRTPTILRATAIAGVLAVFVIALTGLIVSQFAHTYDRGREGIDFRWTIWQPAADVLDGLNPYDDPSSPGFVAESVYPPLTFIVLSPLSWLSFDSALVVWQIAPRRHGARDPGRPARARLAVLRGVADGIPGSGGRPVRQRHAPRRPARRARVALARASRSDRRRAFRSRSSIKLLVAPLWLWLVFTRRFRAALLTAVLVPVGILVPWLLIGLDGLADYPSLLRSLSESHGGNGVLLQALGRQSGLDAGPALRPRAGGCGVLPRRRLRPPRATTSRASRSSEPPRSSRRLLPGSTTRRSS